MTKLTLIIGLFLLISCESTDEGLLMNSENLVVGYWISPESVDSSQQYTRSASLKENEYGMAILPDGRFIERKINGWCGTPPVTFADYDGSWLQNDSTMNIEVGYWGGQVEYTWKIVSADGQHLVIHLEGAVTHENF